MKQGDALSCKKKTRVFFFWMHFVNSKLILFANPRMVMGEVDMISRQLEDILDYYGMRDIFWLCRIFNLY